MKETSIKQKLPHVAMLRPSKLLRPMPFRWARPSWKRWTPQGWHLRRDHWGILFKTVTASMVVSQSLGANVKFLVLKIWGVQTQHTQPLCRYFIVIQFNNISNSFFRHKFVYPLDCFKSWCGHNLYIHPSLRRKSKWQQRWQCSSYRL